MLIFIVVVVALFSCTVSLVVYRIYRSINKKSEEESMRRDDMFEMELLDFTEKENERARREEEELAASEAGAPKQNQPLLAESTSFRGLMLSKYHSVVTGPNGKKVRVVAVPRLRKQPSNFPPPTAVASALDGLHTSEQPPVSGGLGLERGPGPEASAERPPPVSGHPEEPPEPPSKKKRIVKKVVKRFRNGEVQPGK